MKSISSQAPIGESGGQGPLKSKTAEELGATGLLKGEIKPLPYKTSKEFAIARNGKNS